MTTAQAQIRSIQYLRGIAAMMVVWHHAAGQMAGIAQYFPYKFGTSGVDLFFVISGFIMVVTTEGTATTSWQFMRRRIVRVVPLYWMLTLLMVGVALLLPGLFKSLQVAPDTLVKSLLFIPHFSNSFPDEVWPLLVPGWTLNFEMYFYLLFGMSLFLPARARLAALLLLLVASVATGIVLRPLATAAGRTYTDFKLLEFAAGALIGHMWHVGRIRLPLGASLVSVVLGFVLLVGVTALPANLAQLLGASAVVLGALQPRIVESRNSLLLLLGNASYSIYLTHLFSLGVMRWLWVKVMPAAVDIPMGIAFMGLAMIACAVGGQAAFLLLEKPMLTWLRKRRQPTHPLATAL